MAGVQPELVALDGPSGLAGQVEGDHVGDVVIADRNRVSQSWSDVDVQLQRRFELIPRLVEIVKGYAGYEQALLTSLTELRTRGLQAPPAAR